MPAWLLPALMAGGSLFGGLLGSKSHENQELEQVQSEQIRAMNKLLGLQTTRMQQADPLYKAMLQLAFGLLPTSARAGVPGLDLRGTVGLNPGQLVPQINQPGAYTYRGPKVRPEDEDPTLRY